MKRIICICTGVAVYFGLFGERSDAQQPQAGIQNQLQSLGETQIAAGLKEALARGVTNAIARLNQQGGFLTNLNVRIGLPSSLASTEKTLRKLKQGYLVDGFITNMNRAAEIAVGEAGPIFGDAIRGMTVADAEAILHGPKDAATRYFQKVSEARLQEKMLPIIQEATAKAGATASYKSLMEKSKLSTFFNFAKGPFDLDSYIDAKTTEGLFKMIADEEKSIRENPAARATDLLQKVFGKVSIP
jgi:hypothetical protein